MASPIGDDVTRLKPLIWMKIALETADRVSNAGAERAGLSTAATPAGLTSVERLVANAFVMPCKSPRFVVSPLTAPVEHDRRRCTGRNTIISAVNKFLDGTLLSISLLSLTLDEIELSTDFQVLLPGRVPSYPPSYPRERRTPSPAILADRTARARERERKREREGVCMCARFSDRLQFFSAGFGAPVDRRLFYRVPLHSSEIRSGIH